MAMSPTSKNALKIGGALILIALFLVCGPLKDRLGSGGKNVEEAPSVASGPPLEPVEVDTTDALEGIAAGVLIGTSAPEPPLEAVKTEDDLPVLPVVAAAATGAAVAAGTGTGSGETVLPAVSAGVPPTTGAADEIAGVVPAVAAASAFDESRASREGPGRAGRAVDIFPPPVAAEGDSLLALSTEPFGMDSGSLLQPCDSPGSGCQNLRGGSNGGGGSVTPFGSGSPRGPR
jgi:hypothetical protein